MYGIATFGLMQYIDMFNKGNKILRIYGYISNKIVLDYIDEKYMPFESQLEVKRCN